MAGKTKYQKCMARELKGKGKHRTKAGRIKAFAKAAKRCSRACKPKNPRKCKRK